MLELIGGILIGIFSPNWLWRLLLPLCIGLLGCVHLAVVKRRTPMLDSWREGLEETNADDDAIRATLERVRDLTIAPLREAGLVGWRLYAFHFIWMTFVSLVVASLTGLVKLAVIATHTAITDG